MTETLRVGERLHIRGHTTDLETLVESMQLDNVAITEARPGTAVGVKVPDRVRPGDSVYKVSEG